MLQPWAQEAIFLSDHKSVSAGSMYQYDLPALFLHNEWDCLFLLELLDGCSVHCIVLHHKYSLFSNSRQPQRYLRKH